MKASSRSPEAIQQVMAKGLEVLGGVCEGKSEERGKRNGD